MKFFLSLNQHISKPIQAMNSLSFFQIIKRKLVKITVIIFLGINIYNPSFSNPIIPGPMIFEIYFGADGWQIEMMNTMYFEDNLDQVWMISEDDAAHFKPGISFGYMEVIIVTQEDFMSEFTINQAGDWLTLLYIDGEVYDQVDYFGLAWGSMSEQGPYNAVSPPVGEQSIALQHTNQPYFEWHWAVKELPNTLGAYPNHVFKRATFSGFVRDENNGPLENVEIDYCGIIWEPDVPEIFTDSNGYFFTDEMFFMTDYIHFKYNGGIIGDTTVSIEPDSANYFEFTLDTLLTGINENRITGPAYSIYNIPNPSSSQTTFIIESDNLMPYQKGVIKIYSETGYIVDIIPIEISGEKQDIAYNFNDNTLSSGLYFYNLEVGRQKMASGKMVITR